MLRFIIANRVVNNDKKKEGTNILLCYNSNILSSKCRMDRVGWRRNSKLRPTDCKAKT